MPKRTGIHRLTLRAGTMMYPRDPALKPERVKKDHDVLALPTYVPGTEEGWSFVRGGAKKEKWYVRAADVYDDDFPDEPNYYDSRRRQ